MNVTSSREEFWITTTALIIFVCKPAKRKFSSTLSCESCLVINDDNEQNSRFPRRRKSLQKRRNSKNLAKFRQHQFDAEENLEIVIPKDSHAVENYTNNTNLRQRAVNTPEVIITEESAGKRKFKQYLREHRKHEILKNEKQQKGEQEQKHKVRKNEETFKNNMGPSQLQKQAIVDNSNHYEERLRLPSPSYYFSNETTVKESNYGKNVDTTPAETYKETVSNAIPNQLLGQTKDNNYANIEPGIKNAQRSNSTTAISNEKMVTIESSVEPVETEPGKNMSETEETVSIHENSEQSLRQVSNENQTCINLSDHEKSIIRKIEEINRNAEELEAQMEHFHETVKSNQYRYIDEMLQRCMSSLDAVDVGKNKHVVFERRKVIKFVNSLLYRLDAKAEENANARKIMKF